MCDTTAPLDDSKLPPIFKLDDFLLWRIFLDIADSDKEIHRIYPYHNSAIHCIRRSSQVCQYWRRVILNSPSLWASVINLTHLRQKTDSWRDLVLERTGRALLTVTGAIEVAQSLLCILDLHWRRIKKLDVVIYDFRSLEDKRWKALQQPAPNLESFRLSCARGTPLLLQDDSTDIPSLFANNAPSLCEFSAPHVILPSTPTWFSHIRILHISSCFTMPQLLDSLQNAPFLEWLDIQHGFTPVAVTGMDRLRERSLVTLPRLLRIQIRSRLTTCIDFLDQIRPAMGCSLAICTDDILDFVVNVWRSPQFLDMLRCVLSRYAREYFALHPVRELSLDISKTRFRLSGYDRVFQPFNAPDCHYFNVWINNESGYTPEIISVLLSCFSQCTLGLATNLIVNIVDILDFDISDPQFSDFIAAIKSIEILQTSIKTIGLLNGLIDPKDPKKNSIFPFLKAIKVHEVDEAQERLEAVITEFFGWRRDIGGEIESLELMVYGYTGPRVADLSFLEELFPGMEVVWKSPAGMKRYVCGGGEPHKLVYNPTSA